MYDIRQVKQTAGTPTDPGGTPTDPNAYQIKLVSGVNIKTINGFSLLGSGNIFIDVNPVADGGSF